MIEFFHAILIQPVLSILLFFDHLVNDFGLSLVLFACLLMLITVPMELIERKRERARAALAPLEQELRKKHFNDPASLRLARQALYKQFRASPFSPFSLWGIDCVLRTLALVGIWLALRELQGASLPMVNGVIYPFLPHFRSLPDTNLNWLVFLGPGWHIELVQSPSTWLLPILVGLMQFVHYYQTNRPFVGSTSYVRVEGKSIHSQVESAPAGCSTWLRAMIGLICGVFVALLAWVVPAGLVFYYLVRLVIAALVHLLWESLTTSYGSLLSSRDIPHRFR
jgi:membrane protein insertase Oxa1/YidC/SpoIIIJ